MGGGKGSKAPKTPDYTGLAAQTGAENRKSAQELTAANRPNQYDARGNSLIWSQDPTTGQWTQKVNLNDQQQMAQNQYDWFAQGRSNRAAAALDPYLKNLEAFTGTPYNPQDLSKYDNSNVNGDNVANALYESVMSRGRTEQARESEALNTQLRNTGLVPGSEAYNRAMQNLLTSQNDANLLASQNATLAGANEARAQRTANLADRSQLQNESLQNFQAQLAGKQNNLNEMNALGAMIAPPAGATFQGFSGATGYNPTDLMGAANNQFSANMAKTNASNSKKGGLLGAGASLGGSYLGSK